MPSLFPSFPPTRQPAARDWTAAELGTWLEDLAQGEAWPSTERLVSIWDNFLDRLRRLQGVPAELRDAMSQALGFSRAGLDAAWSAVLATVDTPACRALLHQDPLLGPRKPFLVILTACPPALALQFLFAALATRRPVLFKTSHQEPWATPWLLEQLAADEPTLSQKLGATYWPGGHSELEAIAFDRVERVVVYGGAATQSSVAARCPPAKLWSLGPKFSVALIDAREEPSGDATALARALATDISLLDQRGCLSLQAIFTPADQATALARSLARGLEWAAQKWPPGSLDTSTLAAIRLCREEAALAGRASPDLPLGKGTVLVEALDADLRLSPGGRLVRLYPYSSLEQALERLQPWQSHLQGVALSDNLAGIAQRLSQAWKISWVTRPGRLQFPDLATWANGGCTAFDLFTAKFPQEAPHDGLADQSLGL